MKINLHDNQKLIAETVTDLPDGSRIVTEVVQQDLSSVLVGTFYYPAGADDPELSRWCGYCDGVLVGCIDCPNNDPHLDCVNNSLYCRS